jgi:dinuclear metal center YbgI/SA1388 family protein
VAIAVDSGLSVIESAISQKAQLLIVHHGLYWGKEQPIRAVFGKKVRALLASGCSLYAAHLPLDAHSELGNNAQLGNLVGLTQRQGFALLDQNYIGLQGELQSPLGIEEVASRLATLPGAGKPLLLQFGPKKIKKVGIISGSGSFALPEAARCGLDLFISGEPKQEAYHLCRELELNAIFAGHYATETVGVKAVAQQLETVYKLQTFFVHEPTGI